MIWAGTRIVLPINKVTSQAKYNAIIFDTCKEEMGLHTANSKGGDLIASK